MTSAQKLSVNLCTNEFIAFLFQIIKHLLIFFCLWAKGRIPDYKTASQKKKKEWNQEPNVVHKVNNTPANSRD